MLEFTVRHRIYLLLLATFLTALLVADITAGKFFRIGSLQVSVGVIWFPITFVLTDIVNEYYGRRGARFLTGTGAAMLILGFGMIFVARALPVASNSPVSQPSFDGVFGISYRFFGASLTAYLLGQLADIQAFQVTKRITGSKYLWLRAVGSTAISQVVDTAIVNAVALAGTMAAGEIVKVTVASYGYKMAVAVLLTPLLYAAHGLITDQLGMEPAPPENAGTPALTR